MAGKRKPYQWGRVRPGDIISFKYKSKSGQNKLQTILVLNPRFILKLKDGGSTKQLIGIKLKSAAKLTMRLTAQKVKFLEKIGDFQIVDEKNELYRLDIKETYVLNDIKGIKRNAYDKIAQNMGISGKYRTYDFLKARKGAVHLEPVRFFTNVDFKKDED